MCMMSESERRALRLVFVTRERSLRLEGGGEDVRARVCACSVFESKSRVEVEATMHEGG